MTTHYQKHIFVCTNQKAEGKTCCANAAAMDIKKYFKKQLVEYKLHGPGKFRVSESGCLGRCGLGPCVVIYPEAVWYSYQSKEDIDKIIEMHLVQDKRIPEFEIDSEQSNESTIL